MTGRELEKLIKAHILPALPGTAVSKRLIYLTPVDLFLRGFFLDCSSTKSAIRPWAFGLPLFVPELEDIHFNFGVQLRHPTMGTLIKLAEEPGRILESEVAPLLKSKLSFQRNFENIDSFMKYLDRHSDQDHPTLLTAKIFTALLRGDPALAKTSYTKMEKIIKNFEKSYAANESDRTELRLAKKHISLAERDLEESQKKIRRIAAKAKAKLKIQ